MASTTSTETPKQAVDKLSESARQVAERLGEKGEEWLAMKDDYVEQARDYVKENPLMALGIALAAGYLFGKITSWR
jgi:ElaB/YqjD/DUF883 family membrane-anchored ribosome-binding protein